MDPVNQASGSSKKGLYIVIGILVVLLIGGYFMRRPYGMNGVNVDRHLNGSTAYSNNQGSSVVVGDSLPEDWPTDAPKYPNATISHATSYNPQVIDGAKGSVAIFTTSDSAQAVTDFYKTQLSSLGWKVNQTVTSGNYIILTATKDKRIFGLNINNSSNRPITVTIAVGTNPNQN